MRRIAYLATVLVTFTWLLIPHTATAQLLLYDDFNDPSNLVRSDLWTSRAFWYSGGPLDSLHIIDNLLFPTSNPKLMIAERVLIPIGGNAHWYHVYTAARETSSVQAEVSLWVCSSGGAATLASIVLAGFSDATSDAQGDVLGILGVLCPGRGAPPELSWGVFQCTDEDCRGSNSLASGSLGPANLGHEYTLRIDRIGQAYRFTADGLPSQDVVPAIAHGAPARSPYFGLLLALNVLSINDGGDFTALAKYDNVMIAP
jgi:hypothetical protein